MPFLKLAPSGKATVETELVDDKKVGSEMSDLLTERLRAAGIDGREEGVIIVGEESV